MLCCHTSLGIGAELVHNQQRNMICLDISLVMIPVHNYSLLAGFIFCHVIVLAQVSKNCRLV